MSMHTSNKNEPGMYRIILEVGWNWGEPNREVFGHIESVKILVILNPTAYMLTPSGFALFIWGILYRFL